MSPRSTAPKPPKPPKPWQRAEAGTYRSADERFTLQSDGAGRWFVADDQSLDELGLARTIGPFATLDAAKGAADAAREAPAAASPLADRLAEAASRPRANRATAAARGQSRGGRPGAGPTTTGPRARTRDREPEPEPVRTWIDDLADRDEPAARRARDLVAALEREGVADADALARRDILGDRPAVATRLLARDVLAAVARLQDPNPVSIADAVAGVLASAPRRSGLPGWELRERDPIGGRERPVRLTAQDLLDAAEPADAGREA